MPLHTSAPPIGEHLYSIHAPACGSQPLHIILSQQNNIYSKIMISQNYTLSTKQFGALNPLNHRPGPVIVPKRGNNFSLSPEERAGVRASFLSHHLEVHGDNSPQDSRIKLLKKMYIPY